MLPRMASLIPQEAVDALVGAQADLARATALAQMYGPSLAASADRASAGAQRVGEQAPGFVEGVQGVGRGLGQVGQGVDRAGVGLSDVGRSVRYASDTVRETRAKVGRWLAVAGAVGAGVTLGVVALAFANGGAKRNGAARRAPRRRRSGR